MFLYISAKETNNETVSFYLTFLAQENILREKIIKKYNDRNIR